MITTSRALSKYSGSLRLPVPGNAHKTRARLFSSLETRSPRVLALAGKSPYSRSGDDLQWDDVTIRNGVVFVLGANSVHYVWRKEWGDCLALFMTGWNSMPPKIIGGFYARKKDFRNENWMSLEQFEWLWTVLVNVALNFISGGEKWLWDFWIF